VKGLQAKEFTLQLAWHHQFQFAGYYMALEKGYYQDAGLDVNILPVNISSSPIKEVIDGRADFGISTSSVILDYYDGLPLVSLAAIFQRSPLVFITKQDSGIRSILDFENKRVMLLDDMRSLELVALLKKYELLDSIERVPSTFNVQDLIDDNTDVFNGYYSNEPYIMESSGIDSVVFDPFDYGIKFYGDLLFTSNRTLKDYPKDVEAFLKASLMGWKYALNHTEETIDVIVDNYRSKISKAQLRYEASIIQQLTQHDIVPLGFQSKERWEQITSILEEIGAIHKVRDLDDFIYEIPKSISWKQIKPYILIFSLLLSFIISWRYHTLYKAKKTILEKENLLLRQSKYAALGEMLSAITHQLKQPLTATSMVLQNIENNIEDKDDKELVSQGLYLINHMAETIDGFRGFYKMDKSSSHFNVSLAIKEAFNLSQGYLKYNNIHFEILCGCGKKDSFSSPTSCSETKSHCSASIHGNSNDLKQIIMNLIQNSKEALSANGNSNKLIQVKIHADSENVVITFEDNGPGVAEEVLDSLFDADVTMKDDGTGLGLYMSKNIIKDNYNGDIKAENTENGAKFTIILPLKTSS